MKLFGYSTGCLLPILRRAWAGQYAARRAGLQQACSGDLGYIESAVANRSDNLVHDGAEQHTRQTLILVLLLRGRGRGLTTPQLFTAAGIDQAGIGGDSGIALNHLVAGAVLFYRDVEHGIGAENLP